MEDGRDTPNVKVGLEVHCQLTALSTKLFCGCSSDYREEEPNTRICPVCAGLPGTLPVLNRRAVELAAMIGLGLNCKVSEKPLFYRKNYFYPDLPKNYQISQYDKAGGVPIASDGWLEVDGKKVRIRRVHLEEDPGKLTYEGTIERSSYSLVDYNRAGIALVEIVTEPDLSTPREAKGFLEGLRGTIESLGASDGELEGAMRCDANVSLSGGPRVEIKNISSFKEVAKALSYEILRQKTFSQGSNEGTTETRHWDERRSITMAVRKKEKEEDYRYFPEPDLPPLQLTRENIERIRSEMPELQQQKAERYVEDYKIPRRAASELAKREVLANLFEESAKMYADSTGLANWIAGDLRAQLERPEAKGKSLPFTPRDFVELLKLVKGGTITRVQAKEVLNEMVKTGSSAQSIVDAKGLSAVRDERQIERALRKVLSEEEALLEKAGSDSKVFNYLIGRVLKIEPKAEPKTIAKLLALRLKKA